MAKGYLIASVTITDPDAYANYAAAAASACAAHGGRVLAKGGTFICYEGDAKTRNVVIEFDSYDLARAYYESPSYTAARQLRSHAASVDLLVVEGI